MKEKLPAFLRKVKEGAYTPDQLDDIDTLSNKIAGDVGSTSDEAIAMLGFLLQNEYVKIEPNKGIILKEDDQQTNKIINMLIKS